MVFCRAGSYNWWSGLPRELLLLMVMAVVPVGVLGRTVKLGRGTSPTRHGNACASALWVLLLGVGTGIWVFANAYALWSFATCYAITVNAARDDTVDRKAAYTY